MKTHDMEERLRSHYRQSARRAQPDPAAKARALAAVADAARRHSPAPAAAPAPAPSGARAATPPQVPATAQAPAHRPVAPDAPAPAHQRRKAPAAAPAGGFAHFAFEQARFVRTWVWAAQAGILALTAAGSLLAPTGEAASCVAAVAAALTVLVGVPDLVRSRESGVAEVEYACFFDFHQVLAARMVALGLTDVAALAFMVLAVPALAGTDPLLVFLHASVPYFATAFGSLWIATHVRTGVTTRCFALGVLAASLAVVAWQTAPALYTASAAGLWAALLALALAATAVEAHACLNNAAAGLDRLGCGRALP